MCSGFPLELAVPTARGVVHTPSGPSSGEAPQSTVSLGSLCAALLQVRGRGPLARRPQLPACRLGAIQILSRARSVVGMGGPLVTVGHGWWGRSERAGDFSPAGPKPPSLQAEGSAHLSWSPVLHPPFSCLQNMTGEWSTGVSGPSQGPPLEAVNISSPQSLLLEIATFNTFFPVT